VGDQKSPSGKGKKSRYSLETSGIRGGLVYLLRRMDLLICSYTRFCRRILTTHDWGGVKLSGAWTNTRSSDLRDD